ncbi:MAG TPA: dTDP-glucose 4,6-dehydratase [bacterium]
MKKLLITGGAGFMGSEFAREAVRRGHNTVVADKLTYAGDLARLKEVKKQIAFCRIDISNRKSVNDVFKKEKPDVVVHFAAESHVDRSILDATPFLNANIVGTQVLLEAALQNKIERFINISTDEVYGELEEKGEFFETTPLNPNSPYSVSKASADMFGRAYQRTHGLPVITVRPSNNYGHWQYPEKLVPVVIIKAMNNERVPVYAKGENRREWLFVSDCVNGIFSILEKGKPGGIYNIGSGEEKRNIDVVKNVLKLLNKPEELIEYVKDRPGHDFRYFMNTEKIKKELNWKPEVSFDEGIEMTVKWYLSNISWVRSKLDYLKKYWKKVYK